MTSRNGCPDSTRILMRKAAIIVAHGVTKAEASRQLGQRKDWVAEKARVFPRLWREELTLAEDAMNLAAQAKPNAQGPTKDTVNRMRRGAAMIAAGMSMAAASRRLGFSAGYLHENARLYPSTWTQCLSLAKQLSREYQNATPPAPGPSPRIRERMLKVLSLMALQGLSMAKAAKAIGTDQASMSQHIKRHPTVWAELCEDLGVADPRKPRGVWPETVEGMHRAAKLLKEGFTIDEASVEVWGKAEALHGHAGNHPELWCDALRKAGVERRPGGQLYTAPKRTIRDRIETLALLVESGTEFAEASRRLGFSSSLASSYRKEYPEFWRDAAQKARKLLRIPDGMRQRAKLYDENGCLLRGQGVKRTRRHPGRVPEQFKKNGARKRSRKKASKSGKKRSLLWRILPKLMQQYPDDTAGQLRKKIKQKTGRDYSESTIYSMKHRLENDGNP